MSAYYNIGKIAAAFGLAGEVILVHKTGEKEPLRGIPAVFVERPKGSFLPYFVESVRTKVSGELYVKLEGVSTRQEATALVGREVYLEEAQFRQAVSQDAVLYYLNFMVRDREAGELGAVAEVIELPSQCLLKVYQGTRELLIPLNDSTLERIDREASVIYVRLPEGLLDIYRG